MAVPEMAIKAVLTPMLIAALGTILSLLGVYAVRVKRGASQTELMAALNRGINLSSFLIAIASAFLLQLFQGCQAVVFDEKGKPGVYAGNGHQVIAGDDAVAPPSAVHFRAFQQKSGDFILSQAQKQADRGLQIGAQTAAALLESNHGWCLHGWWM